MFNLNQKATVILLCIISEAESLVFLCQAGILCVPVNECASDRNKRGKKYGVCLHKSIISSIMKD